MMTGGGIVRIGTVTLPLDWQPLDSVLVTAICTGSVPVAVNEICGPLFGLLIVIIVAFVLRAKKK